MTKISFSKPSKVPLSGNDTKPVDKSAKSGHREAVIHNPDKPTKTKFSLSALARNIGKALLCRNVDTIDSISTVQYLPKASQPVEEQIPPPYPDDLDEDDDVQDLINELSDQLDRTDSGFDSTDESDQGSMKKLTTTAGSDKTLSTATSSSPRDLSALVAQNVAMYPVRETIRELEELTDSLEIKHFISVFLDACRANPKWRDNPLDLNMGALRRVQSFINNSPLNMKEKNDLLRKMANTALTILLLQLPKYSEKEAFAWLDVYEQILLSNTCPEKLTLYDIGHKVISSHYAKQDPWHAQMGRLDRGQGSFIAFANLILNFDNEQKRLMMGTFLQEKERKIHRLEKVVEQYKALNDGSMDKLPLVNNPRYVELLELAAEERSLRKRIGDWTESMIRLARNTLNAA